MLVLTEGSEDAAARNAGGTSMTTEEQTAKKAAECS